MHPAEALRDVGLECPSARVCGGSPSREKDRSSGRTPRVLSVIVGGVGIACPQPSPEGGEAMVYRAGGPGRWVSAASAEPGPSWFSFSSSSDWAYGWQAAAGRPPLSGRGWASGGSRRGSPRLRPRTALTLLSAPGVRGGVADHAASEPGPDRVLRQAGIRASRPAHVSHERSGAAHHRLDTDAWSSHSPR